MSQLKEFNAKAEKDQDLKKKVTEAWLKMERACDPIHKEYAQTLVKLGADAGCKFTVEDIAHQRMAAAAGELDEAALDQVAGGATYARLPTNNLITPTYSTNTLNLNQIDSSLGGGKLAGVT